MNFWYELKQRVHSKIQRETQRPLVVLAPMADVTDPAFRRIIAKYGKPDVMWTEFVSADGLFKGGYDALVKDLAYSEAERPIIAQFFTGSPEMMSKSAELACDLGFDGIDINMGCPDKSIEKQGGGASLIKNPKLAQEIIAAAKEGVLKATVRGKKEIPVSVKTRIGYNKNELETWLPALLDAEPAVITLHARTRKEMSLVPAHWEYIKRAVEIRNEWADKKEISKEDAPLIFGNGDVVSVQDAEKKAEEAGCDGVMLGRAIFGNPWLFSTLSKGEKQSGDVSLTERLRVLVEHTQLYEKLLPHKSFAIMKKHYKAYVNGWDGAKELRMRLMETKTAREVEVIIADYKKYGSK